VDVQNHYGPRRNPVIWLSRSDAMTALLRHCRFCPSVCLAFKWHYNHWPWMTLKGHNALWCANCAVLCYTVSRNNHHDMRRARQSFKLIACVFKFQAKCYTLLVGKTCLFWPDFTITGSSSSSNQTVVMVICHIQPMTAYVTTWCIYFVIFSIAVPHGTYAHFREQTVSLSLIPKVQTYFEK